MPNARIAGIHQHGQFTASVLHRNDRVVIKIGRDRYTIRAGEVYVHNDVVTVDGRPVHPD